VIVLLGYCSVSGSVRGKRRARSISSIKRLRNFVWVALSIEGWLRNTGILKALSAVFFKGILGEAEGDTLLSLRE
jgi:hypothetical protein